MLSEHTGSPEKRVKKTAAARPTVRPTGLGSARYLQLFERLNPLVGLLDARRISAKACDLIAELLDVAACSLLLADSTETWLQLSAATHIAQAEWPKVQSPISGTVGGRVLRDGKSLLINGRAAFRKAFGREPVERYLTPSCAIVPLPLLGRTAGVINVAHPIGRRAFRQRDIALLEAAANLIGAALATANQYQETREQQDYLVDIVDSLHVGLITVDSRGRVVNANERMRRMLGVVKGQVVGRSMADLLPGNLLNVCRRLMEDSDHTEEPAQDRLIDVLDEKTRSLEVTAAPLRPLGGVVDHHLLIFEDVGRDEEVKRLRESESMKRSFLSIISHELRTPIAVIRPALSLIDPKANGGVPADTLTQVHRLLVKNTNRLNDVISGILDVTEIENGTLKLALRPVDLHEIFDEILAEQAERAQSKDITLVREFVKPDPIVPADRRRLRQIFSALLDNAIKFCNPGNRVRLATRLNEPWVEVELSNNGPMIEPERRVNLFEKFYQCNQTMTRTAGGCGLGLFLARNLLLLHGGSIELKESTQDITTFVIRLPLGITVAAAEPPRPAHAERDDA